MMNAYDKLYLEKARICLGRSFDYAVYDLRLSLSEYWTHFLNSRYAKYFEHGDPSVLVGRSGIELALDVLGIDCSYPQPQFREGRSPEYWTGWALAYYQWKHNIPFAQIADVISIDEICSLYSPYHEMDIEQFCDEISRIYKSRKNLSSLKTRRESIGLSQSELAENTGIPLRTIQQYEQGQKNINHARAEYVVALSQALYCDPKDLLELI